MNFTQRKPVTPGEMLQEEFLKPLGLTQQVLADAMGVTRRTVNEICKNKRSITADSALMLARVFGNSPDFWLNPQLRLDLWNAMHDAKRMQRIEMAQPIDTGRESGSPL